MLGATRPGPGLGETNRARARKRPGADQETRPLIGQTVGNYRMKRLLGEGGMGTVYLAEHALMGWRAAVKVLRRSLADDKVLVRRFMNEAHAIKSIRHPNIVDIIDVGVLPDGLPYLLMELLEGESLGARLQKRGRLPVTLAVAHRRARPRRRWARPTTRASSTAISSPTTCSCCPIPRTPITTG